MESALIAILLTKLEAQNLCDVLPPCEERRKLRNKMLACDIALNFSAKPRPAAGNSSRKSRDAFPNIAIVANCPITFAGKLWRAAVVHSWRAKPAAIASYFQRTASNLHA